MNFHRDTFHVLRPNSKIVYIEFIFKGEKAQTQFWSPPLVGSLGTSYAMKFNANIEPLMWNVFKLNKGINDLGFSKDLPGGRGG